MSVEEILRGLVAIPTASSRSNLPLLEFVKSILDVLHWRVELLRYIDEAGVEKANLLGRPRAARWNEDIGLAYVCHTDTVPPASDWTSALTLTCEDDQLHGCGSCDVKGSLACFLSALQTLERERVRLDVALLLSADEEIGCKGMERFLAETKLRIAAAIVSEPTSLRAGIAGKGYGLARISVQGIEAHSAYPNEGVSAISVAAQFITRIGELKELGTRTTDPLFDPPRTTINIGMIEGGSAKNIIAGFCSFLVEWRPIPAESPTTLFGELQELARDVEADHQGAQIKVERLRAEPGFSPSSEGPLRRRLLETGCNHNAARKAMVGVSFGSEASRISRISDEVIVIGPGDMHTAHSARECVPIAELEDWTNTLRILLKG